MNSVTLTMLVVASTNLALGYTVAVCLGWNPAARRRALREARQRQMQESAAVAAQEAATEAVAVPAKEAVAEAAAVVATESAAAVAAGAATEVAKEVAAMTVDEAATETTADVPADTSSSAAEVANP